MKRRAFLGSGMAAGVTTALSMSCGGGPEDELVVSAEARLPATIGGLTLEELWEDYRRRLFDEYLPFWDKGGYDRELGGFMCNLNDDGSVADDEKYIWYQGRAIWVYSFLYNNFGKEEKYLEIARKTRDFMVTHMKAENGEWYERVHRDGSLKEGVSDNIYGWLFAANGLAELYKAAGNEEDLKIVIETIWAAVRAYDKQTYTGVRNYGGLAPDVSFEGFRAQGHSMVLIRLLSQLLDNVNNRKLEELLAEHVDLIMEKFNNPDFGISNEYLQHDYSRIPGYEDYMFTGHSIETMWMIMFEAIRTHDRKLFKEAMLNIRRYLEMSWDYVYEGFGDGHFYVFDGPDRTREKLYGVKSMWSHCEVLIALLHILEYTAEPWASEWYARARGYAVKAYDTDYGVWRQAVDRYGRDVKRERVAANRKGNFHYPRYLMLNLLCLERMMDNKGMPTQLL